MPGDIARGWGRLIANVARPRCLIGASVFRVLAGVGMLWEYLGVYHQRHFLFGPHGIDDWGTFHATFSRLSLYALSPSPLWFELIFHLGALVAFLWMIGFRTAITTPLNFLFWTSLMRHASGVWDGGDNLLALVVFYACFANVGTHLSIESRSAPAPTSSLRAILHNGAMLAVALQLSIVYAAAGLAKARGALWLDGTALYYAMRAPQFTLPGWSELIFRHALLVTAFSYATVAFQIGFFFCVFLNRFTRFGIIFVSVAFHLGIMTFMGLISFGLFLMAADLSILGDEEYLTLFHVCRRAVAALRELLPAGRPSSVSITVTHNKKGIP